MRTPTEERFWSHVSQSETNDCWIWTGAKHRGYGQFTVEYFKNDAGDWRCRTERAHRFAYETLIAPIPEGLTLDHLCRQRDCVNPWHLDPCPAGVNVQRALTSTMCKKGLHSMDDETNVIRRPSKPHERECRACANERNREKRRAVAA